MSVEITKSIDPAAWDALVAAHPAATIFQSAAWGACLEECPGHEPFYLLARDGNGRPAAALLGFVRTPYHEVLHGRPGLRWLLRGLRALAPVATWRYGPLFFVDPVVAAPACAAALEAYLRRRGVAAIEGAVTALPDLSGKFPDPMEGWLPAAGPAATFLLDLLPAPEALWRRLQWDARTPVRGAQRAGVTVRRLSSLEELRAYYEFFQDQNVQPLGRWPSADFLAALWRHLRPAGGIEVFAAEREGELLAGLSVLRFAGYLYEDSFRQSRACRLLRIAGHDLIKWEIIRWGHETGAQAYDLAGVAPAPGTDRERGIRHFQEKWGGVYVEYALRGKTLRPLRHGLLSLGARVYRRLR